jgi:two-component system chemotaxis sensor kinase CheA
MFTSLLKIKPKIMLGYVLILICLGLALLVVSSRVTDLQKEVSYVSSHDMDVHDQSHSLLKHMLDMETGMRGYVLTGNEQYLDPYYEGSRNWQVTYDHIHQLISDNPSQVKNLEGIEETIQSWLTTSGEYVIRMKKENNTAAINEFFKQNTGKKSMDQLRTQLDTFLVAEKALTSTRVEQISKSNYNLKVVLFTILGLISIVAIVVALILSNSITNTIKQIGDRREQSFLSHRNLLCTRILSDVICTFSTVCQNINMILFKAFVMQLLYLILRILKTGCHTYSGIRTHGNSSSSMGFIGCICVTSSQLLRLKHAC